MEALFGRDREREVATRFVAAAASGPAALAIDGEPGIGKTSLFRFVLGQARDSDTTVLDCNPTHAESAMSFAALTELLRHVPDPEFEALPSPQRHALRVATLREEPAGAVLDERAVGTGLASLLFHLAEVNPLVVAIDDLQWIDRASAGVLTFALRRVHTETIGLLTCARSGERPASFDSSIPSDGWHNSLTLSGLTASALFHVVRDQLTVTLARPTLLRVTETSGGNPFAAIELARAIGTGVGTSRPDGTRLNELLHALTADRLGRLSQAARRALLAVASSPRPTIATMRALGLDAALEEAESSGTIMLDGDRVVFAHPLLSAAIAQMASAPQQREMHAQLAAVTDDPEARARHRALALPERDESTAAALDTATFAAQARGSSVAAAELAQLAVERTIDPDSDLAWARRIRLAELLHSAGSSLEAQDVLQRPGCPAGALRARALLVLIEIAFQTTTIQRAIDLAHAALAEAGDDPTLSARCLLSLATLTTDGHESARFAAKARETLEAAGVDDFGLLAWAECEDVSARFNLGHGLDVERLERALELERAGRSWRSGDQVAAVRPVLLKWADRPEMALLALQELRARAEDEGNEGLIPYVLGHIPGILLRLGRLTEAAQAAADHLGHAERTGQESQRMQALYSVALVGSHRGRLDEAAGIGDEIVTWAAAECDAWLEMSGAAIVGFVALSRGDHAEACTWLARWANGLDQLGIVDPGVSRFHGDFIEGLIATGAIDEAAQRTTLLETRAETAGRISAQAIASRCRALLAAQTGDVVSAIDHIDRALAFDDACPVAFERHRTLLVKGLIHRRAKEKSAAKQALQAAATGFTAMGADAWTQRCEHELARIGTRASSATALTASERTIAELAARGLTNKQVAEHAFLSPKTVEANLARVYRKFGITSRAELGAHIANENRSFGA